MSHHARPLQETHTCSPSPPLQSFPSGYEQHPDKPEGQHIAKRGRHLCKKVTGSETAYIFFVAKDGEKDHKWRNKETHWNVPRARIHDFCPNCRRIPEEEYRGFGLDKHPFTRNECWQCMCS